MQLNAFSNIFGAALPSFCEGHVRLFKTVRKKNRCVVLTKSKGTRPSRIWLWQQSNLQPRQATSTQLQPAASPVWSTCPCQQRSDGDKIWNLQIRLGLCYKTGKITEYFVALLWRFQERGEINPAGKLPSVTRCVFKYGTLLSWVHKHRLKSYLQAWEKQVLKQPSSGNNVTVFKTELVRFWKGTEWLNAVLPMIAVGWIQRSKKSDISRQRRKWKHWSAGRRKKKKKKTDQQ